MTDNPKGKIAVWALTARGAALAQRIEDRLDTAEVMLPAALDKELPADRRFERFSDAVNASFHAYAGHIFIMSAGIVVRTIAGVIQSKVSDPAVVVIDETGRYAVSLLSGHLGGANDLARSMRDILGAEPVITTATDVHGLPAVDLLAQKHGLTIENPERIKTLNMAVLTGAPIRMWDPYGFFSSETAAESWLAWKDTPQDARGPIAGVWIDDTNRPAPDRTLFLRPRTLAVGIGCNRGTDADEILTLLSAVFNENDLAIGSIDRLATIDIKSDEAGITMAAAHHRRPVVYYNKNELNRVEDVPTPSATVEKYTGAKSVCEAAAILASKMGRLIVPKRRTKNVTLAVARTVCL